jgi:hypothetical protein
MSAIAGAALLLLSLPLNLAAQVVVGRPTGELAADFEGAAYSFPENPDDGRRTFKEWLLLRTNGYVSDPRLVRFDLTLRPLLGQRSWTGPLPSPTGDIQRLDGRAALSLLSGAPISLQLDGLRLADDQVLRYGAEQSLDLETWGTRLDLKWRPLPLWAEYRDESRRLIDRPRPETVRPRDESWRTVRIGAENRKTRLRFERLDYDNRIGTTDFLQNKLDANNRFRWGKGSQLTSSFQHVDRRGSGAVERLSWKQRAGLQHTVAVRSDLGYVLYNQSTPTDFRRGWEGDYTASVRTSPRVELLLEGRSRYTEFRLGSQSYSRVGPRAVFGTRLAGALDLRIAAATGYEWHAQQVSEEGTGTVVDERHVVSPSGSFFLREPFPEQQSVVLKSEDATLTFEPGLDYRLVPTGALVEVVTLPGGRMEPGTVVLADYEFRLLPGGSANAWIYDYDVTLTAGPVSLYHRRRQQTELGDAPPTPIASLREYDDMTVGIRASGGSPVGTLSLTAQYDDRSARTFDFSGFQVRGSWGFLLGPRLRGAISGGWSNRVNGTEYRIWEGESRLEWTIVPGLRLVGRLAAYDWVDIENSDLSSPADREERFVGGGIGAEWRLHKFVVGARYDHNVWTLGFERMEDRVYVRIAREF